MTKRGFVELTAKHFTMVAVTMAAVGSLARAWDDAPWYAYLLLLALAPLTALVSWGFQAARTAWLVRRREKLVFPPGFVARLAKATVDLLGAVCSGSAGITPFQCDQSRVTDWVDRILKSAHDTLNSIDSLPDDAHVIWLQANPDQRTVFASAACNAPEGYLAKHIVFEKGDGLAGRVWESGQAALHSASRPHPHWQSRPGCDNAAYVCVPVGRRGGPGGVLSLGSDTGFEATRAHVVVLEMFASILALTAEAEPQCGSEGTRS